MARVQGGAGLAQVQSGESPEGLGPRRPEVAHVAVREEADLRHSKTVRRIPGGGTRGGGCDKGPAPAHLGLLPTGQWGEKPLLTARVVRQPCWAQGPLALWRLREAQGVGAGGRERGDPVPWTRGRRQWGSGKDAGGPTLDPGWDDAPCCDWRTKASEPTAPFGAPVG